PHVAVTVHKQAVRPIDQAGTEASYQLAGGIEFLDRIEHRADAGLAPTAVINPDAAAIGVNVDAYCLSPCPPFRNLRPVLNDAVRICVRIGFLAAGLPIP